MPERASAYPHLTINEGKVRCPTCDKDVKVRMGGVQNFWKQHNPGVSKSCKENLRKNKKAATHQRSQPSIQAFFTKPATTHVPPTIPTPSRIIAYAVEAGSSGPCTMPVASVAAPPVPNTHTVNVLVTLERAIRALPTLPEATETDEMAVFSQRVPTELDKEEAWEYLDPLLNHFLGFNRSVESISKALRGGENGLAAMVRYLKEFVSWYEIDEGLLEGKVSRLVRAIQMW